MDRNKTVIARDPRAATVPTGAAVARPRKSPVRKLSQRISASQLNAMSKVKRNKIMDEQFESGASLYGSDPKLIFDGAEDIIPY